LPAAVAHVKLRARQFEFTFPRPALVMGIVNVTPDSFWDGGKYLQTEAAVAHALELVRQGADILDIGGESTRPQAQAVSEAEELRRVLPVLERLAGVVAVPISIDTRKVEVARAALDAGASIVNDIGANRQDPAMFQLVAHSRAGYVCTHMQGTPATMQLNPVYGDVLAEVESFFVSHLNQLSDCGVTREQIMLDPGIGFGKTLEHTLELLGSLGRFRSLDRPLLLGVSRKSFMGQLLGAQAEARLPGALACACLAVQAGVQIIRAHDVAETVQALRMTEAILSRSSR
jgi:dihydropteroate synthase